jgi:hypothetical protein
MKVTVELDIPAPHGYLDPDEVDALFGQAAAKVMRQTYRAPGCICTALEEDDVVRNHMGTVIGTVKVEP